MGRARQTTGEGSPPKGHNAKKILTQEDRDALLVHHIGKLRAQDKIVGELREPFKAAQEDFTSLVNAAKADLGKGYTRKRLVGLLEDSASRLRDLAKEEEQRFHDRRALGLPTFGSSEQLNLFGDENTPAEARDELQWEADGYLAGRRAADRDPPKGCEPRFHPTWLKGYGKGQDSNADFLRRAQEAIDARNAANAEPELDETPPADEVDEDLAVDEAARKLKREGWTQPSNDEAAFKDNAA